MTTKIEGGLPAKPVETPAVGGSTQARAGGSRDAAIAATPEADSLKLTGEAAGLKAIARELATPASLDMARINEIRAAIDAGSYRVNPQEIANRLLALERELLR